MLIDFNGTKLNLDPKEVASTKRLITKFIDEIKEKSEIELAPTYYFTLLFMMHVISQDMLNDFDQVSLEKIMEVLGTRK